MGMHDRDWYKELHKERRHSEEKSNRGAGLKHEPASPVKASKTALNKPSKIKLSNRAQVLWMILCWLAIFYLLFRFAKHFTT